MKKKLEMWLASIMRAELNRTETLAVERAERLETSIATLVAEIKEHAANTAADVKAHTAAATDEVKVHAAEMAADIHAKVSADAKAIAEFRRSVRMPCSLCGQMTYDYAVKSEARKIICSDCQKKGDQ